MVSVRVVPVTVVSVLVVLVPEVVATVVTTGIVGDGGCNVAIAGTTVPSKSSIAFTSGLWMAGSSRMKRMVISPSPT